MGVSPLFSLGRSRFWCRERRIKKEGGLLNLGKGQFSIGKSIAISRWTFIYYDVLSRLPVLNFSPILLLHPYGARIYMVIRLLLAQWAHLRCRFSGNNWRKRGLLLWNHWILPLRLRLQWRRVADAGDERGFPCRGKVYSFSWLNGFKRWGLPGGYKICCSRNLLRRRSTQARRFRRSRR